MVASYAHPTRIKDKKGFWQWCLAVISTVVLDTVRGFGYFSKRELWLINDKDGGQCSNNSQDHWTAPVHYAHAYIMYILFQEASAGKWIQILHEKRLYYRNMLGWNVIFYNRFKKCLLTLDKMAQVLNPHQMSARSHVVIIYNIINPLKPSHD
jgi:hypothetical protein